MRISTILLCFVALTQLCWAQEPRRIMILVFDQMRAEYIERFDLPNFKRAQAMGVNFENGIVGHLESNTVISHPVISTGKLPRNMPWCAQLMKDVEGWLGPKGEFYSPTSMKPEEWNKLHLLTSGDSSLLARLRWVNSGPTFAIAQKEYSAYNFGGPYVRTVIALGSALKDGEFAGHHGIAGQNIPEYIAQPVGNRFYLEATNTWGSEVERYSLRGNGYVTGDDPSRPGGDAWVGDVVEQVMKHESDWSAILASFGAIDKVGHVLAEHNQPTESEWAIEAGINLEDTLHKADAELGRILDRLERQGLLKETALVITADHGGQKNSYFHGRPVAGRHKHDQNYAKGRGFNYTKDPNPHWRPILMTGTLDALTIDTLALFWLKDARAKEAAELTPLVAEMPGMAEVYSKKPNGDYKLQFRSTKMSKKQRAWAERHHQELVNTLGGKGGPDIVGMMFDDHGYSMMGAHGGAQEMCQRIPMIVISPNLVRRGATAKRAMRLVDINPVLGRLLGLPEHSGLDGDSSFIEPFLRSK